MYGFMIGTTFSTPSSAARWISSMFPSSPTAPMTVRNALGEVGGRAHPADLRDDAVDRLLRRVRLHDDNHRLLLKLRRLRPGSGESRVV